MKIYSPWEKAFDKVYSPLEHFIHAQTTTGLILIFTTIIAIILANSPLNDIYQSMINTKIDITVGGWKISHSLHLWVNDGLMAIFFFLIGLEIKREILTGELSSIQVAILPVLCAIGGMLMPALIYYAINNSGEGYHGWGIPVATDIAFAISALVLLGKRVSPALVTFLVALAIVDDLGAVLIIALFYTDNIHIVPLLLSGLSFMIMLSINRFGIRAILPYFILALTMWFFMLESGIHATIAGVITALSIPSKPNSTPIDFTHHSRNLLDEYDSYPVATDHVMHEKQKAILRNITDKISSIDSPSARLEQSLHLPISLIIIPLFALVNAGIKIDVSSIISALTGDVSLGIIFGLVFGKIIGIFGIAYLAIKLKIAKLPQDSSMSQIFGVAALGGIGFTMSIFVSELAFANNHALASQAKSAILVGSLLAALIGFLWLRFVATKEN